MDVRIVFAKKEIGNIPYESIPAVFLILRENGFPYKWDEKNRCIHLRSGLEAKKILLMKETLNLPYFDDRTSEDFVDGIYNSLKSCGATVYLRDIHQTNVRINLCTILAIQEDPTIDIPKLDVFHDLKAINQKWPSVLNEECREAGIHFTSNVNALEANPYMKFLMKVPRSEKTLLSNTLFEKFQVIISMGILARLQANYPLFLLSYLPYHQISFQNKLSPNGNKVNSLEEGGVEKHGLIVSESTLSFKKKAKDKNVPENYGAEVFFDYQVIVDNIRNEKILLFGNIIIKNTGNTALLNPVICLRITPQGIKNFSGQLVPPNIAQTRGVLNREKGWKYMYDDWFQQAEEKGEIWISPIHYMEILPSQTESFQNFRINLFKDEHQQNIKVDGLVFFKEQGLEYKANNTISLSF